MANYVEKFFLGTSQTVIDTAADVAAGNFSVTTTTFDNTSDGAYPYAPNALAMAEFPDWAAAPVQGTVVSLWGIVNNVDGTDDETQAPSGTGNGGAHWFGQWVISANDALQRRAIVIDIFGFTSIDFYFKNETAQNMNNDAGTNAVVKITPLVRAVVG
jgi:hypothetical protein